MEKALSAPNDQATLQITGMTCAACAADRKRAKPASRRGAGEREPGAGDGPGDI